MAKKSTKSYGTAGRVAPHMGGPKRGPIAPSVKGSLGGWKNSKPGGGTTSPGATDRTSPSAYTSVRNDMGGLGKNVSSGGPTGSLGMVGVVMVKHPTSGPTQYNTAVPGGPVAKKYAKQKARGK